MRTQLSLLFYAVLSLSSFPLQSEPITFTFTDNPSQRSFEAFFPGVRTVGLIDKSNLTRLDIEAILQVLSASSPRLRFEALGDGTEKELHSGIWKTDLVVFLSPVEGSRCAPEQIPVSVKLVVAGGRSMFQRQLGIHRGDCIPATWSHSLYVERFARELSKMFTPEVITVSIELYDNDPDPYIRAQTAKTMDFLRSKPPRIQDAIHLLIETSRARGDKNEATVGNVAILLASVHDPAAMFWFETAIALKGIHQADLEMKKQELLSRQ